MFCKKHVFRNHFLKNHFVLYIKAFKATIQNLVAACLLVYLFTDSKLKLAKLQLYNNSLFYSYAAHWPLRLVRSFVLPQYTVLLNPKVLNIRNTLNVFYKSVAYTPHFYYFCKKC